MKTTYHNALSADEGQGIIDAIIAKMPWKSKQQGTFLKHILTLFMVIRGRRNFTNAARYGFFRESVYRRRFAESFDWLMFNTTLVTEHGSGDHLLAFDPSFLPKSRNKTAHVGTFWSGVAGKTLHGLEIGSIAAVDLERNTALSLEAIQTPTMTELKEQDQTLTDHYTRVIVERREALENIAKYLAVDGYFGKKKFFDGVLGNTTLQIITKLRSDADLQYLYTGEQRPRRGRPKQFDGKVRWDALDLKRWNLTVMDEKTVLLSSVLWSPTLKRKLLVVAIFVKKNDGFERVAVLASSDTTISASRVLAYYTARFQIEFLFRDAKQHAGLTHCQARSEEKINFHVNASLTAVSVAKVAHFFDRPNPTYSLFDVGMAYFNQFFASLFFSKLDFEPTSEKISSVLPSLLNFGLIHGG